ncbi:location of vulva defective 1-like isoform X2 [Ostrinia furnacalis]|uniref:location of vulva defective 1-like isoform X2 n=1 Tax=Ostrinia furnacalis TaxID=93504 RepID=UPI00103E0F0B|nr:location of vulva defective 1-like isoform X2 [Ostrinia furnacalis]
MANHINIAVFLVLCVAWQAYGATVNCTATGAGRFANSDDTTCQNYTLCVYDSSTGTYLSYDYVCPSTSVFNPNTGLCTASSNYACTVTTTTVATTTVSTETCTAEGFFVDSSSSDCSTYIQCVLIDGTYDETTLTCPNNTYYNPNTTLCDSDYECTTTTTTVTTEATTTVSTSFSCTAAGRYANPADSTCKTYYYCVATTTTGNFTEYLYTCPSTSLFNPTSKLCSGSYTCS